MNIPISAENVYIKYGLNYGHKTFIKIFLGTFILQAEKMNVFIGAEELEKQKLEALKILFSKNDLEIIDTNLNNLPSNVLK
jgi:hypothetical protein